MGLVDLQEQDRINTTLLVFTGLASWTPAMGALLVSGIDPAGRPRDIPAGNLGRVGNPGVAASEAQIQWAHKVFANWLDCQLENDGTSNIQASKVDIKPAEFLMWCMEDYDDFPTSMKPLWLDYITSLLGWNHQLGVPLPAPSSLVTRAAALEKLGSPISAERTQTKSIPGTLSPDDAMYVERLSASLRSNVDPVLAERIIEALGRAGNPRELKLVWLQLCKIAESGKYDDLKFSGEIDGEGHVLVPGVTRRWKPFTRGALGQCLNKQKPR